MANFYDLSIGYSEADESLELAWESQGAPFNPLDGDDAPDELGLVLLRGMTDALQYDRKDNVNRLQMQLRKGAI